MTVKITKDNFIKFLKIFLDSKLKISQREMEDIALIYFFDSEEEMYKKIGK